MIVVSDSTPLITLMKAMHLDLLHDLFGEILIPVAVYSELTMNQSYANEAVLIQNCCYIKVVNVESTDHVEMLQRATGLDRGESEAIVYADESKADLLLMDESKGRKVAQNMNLPIAGSMGILIRAYRAGLMTVDEIDEAIGRLRESTVHISERLFQSVHEAVHRNR